MEVVNKNRRKTYEIARPNGDIEAVDDITKFCANDGVPGLSTLCALAKKYFPNHGEIKQGKNKGWKIKILA